MRQRQWLRRRPPQPPPAPQPSRLVFVAAGGWTGVRGFWYLGAPGTQGPHWFEFKLEPALNLDLTVPV